MPHSYYADFVVWNTILFEAKAVEKLTDSHIKQVLNYLAASKPPSVCWSILEAIPWNGKGWFYDTTSQGCFNLANLAPENADRLMSIRGIRVSFHCYGIDFPCALRETWLR